LTDEGTLDSAIACLLTHLPLEMEGRSTLRDLFAILLRAASRGDSLEHTVRSLKGALSGHGVRYHWDKLADMALLERQVNATLHSQIPPKIAQKRHRMAIDWHLLPYYDSPTEAAAPTSIALKQE
jgi:putative transposase